MLNKKVLLIEPYYGGSHKQFLEGLVKYVDADYMLLHLPARKWKMRMQLAAPWFVQKVIEMDEKDRRYDLVLMSSFMDVAVFRALVSQLKGWHQDTRFFTYFHENQFSYPGVLAKETTHQFTAINFTTALASDRLAFKGSVSLMYCGSIIQYSSSLPNLSRKILKIFSHCSSVTKRIFASGYSTATSGSNEPFVYINGNTR